MELSSPKNFPRSKNKKTHYGKMSYISEMELSSLKLKELLIFQEKLPKPQKPQFLMNKLFNLI